MTEQSAPAKILIVEDEALIARELKHRLTNMGWEVVGTAFGEEAVEMAIETRPDLLLSDIHLRHGLSGIDLAQRIQEVIDVPVVFLTAYSDEDTVAKAKTITPFGYIIKPVENRELQITIEMALYKFRIEKELREKQQLLETALACIGNALVFLDGEGRVSNGSPEAESLLGRSLETGVSWRSMLGDTHTVVSTIEDALTGKNLAKLPPFLLQRRDLPAKLVDGIVGPIDTGAVLILRDLGDIENPVKLGAAERFARLGAEYPSPSESAFCQLLISPDDVEDEMVAAIVEQVRGKLDASLRATDLASVFSHSMISVSLPYTDIIEGQKIANTLLDELEGYRFQDQAVSFNAGLAYSTGGDQEPIELFRRATAALDTARRSGQQRLSVAIGDGSSTNMEAREISGAKDYRHVVLLWNVMNALSAASDLPSICEEFCRNLFHVFRADRSALLTMVEGRLKLDIGYSATVGRTLHISDMQFSEKEFAAINAVSKGELKEQLLENTVVLGVANRWVMLLSGSEFNEEDHVFLETLCTYFASSIAQVDVPIEVEANDGVPEHTLVQESEEMRRVLDTALLAAPTDATILLSGESGTGKELVARYIHEQSQRNNEPLIVVDCGAVAPSLIESELFGHAKGAFTGATASFKGRLKEAAGGTVLLDEIGELPLETQVKLLRFVQDRQVAAVGSNQYETVDARVIAATNKDLKEMVEAGQFREDLFYRLNVFSISVPPLRDRPKDILAIARHYLAIFAARYKKPLVGFTPDAEQALSEHDWPGNVRELSNVVNRAVILSKDQYISPIQLGIFSDAEIAIEDLRNEGGLRAILKAVVDLGLLSNQLSPVGRFLEEDFILMSVTHHGGILNKAALAIAVPESTLRRKIQKIEEVYGSTDPARPADWPVTMDLYREVMSHASQKESYPLDLLTALVLNEIEARKLNRSKSAQLLGVSLPTYRRLVEESAIIF